MSDNINFAEQKIVSVSEVNTNKKFELLTLGFFIASLVLAFLVFAANLFVTKAFDSAKADEDQLVARIQSSENSKKEGLFFLIKNRLSKINSITSGKIKEGNLLGNIIEINKFIRVKDAKVVGRGAELKLTADDYSKFQSFLDNSKNYGIADSSMLVDQTALINGGYQIAVKFAFK